MLDDVVSYCVCIQNWYSNYKKQKTTKKKKQNKKTKQKKNNNNNNNNNNNKHFILILGSKVFGGHFEWRSLSEISRILKICQMIRLFTF